MKHKYTYSIAMVVLILFSVVTQAGNSRLSVLNENLKFKKNGIRFESVETNNDLFNLRFKYSAHVESPQSTDGARLQATQFAFSGSLAFITYNQAGASTSGAMDIIDISNPDEPKLIGEIVRSDSEYSDVYVRNSFAYLVGVNVNSGPVLHIYDVSHPGSIKFISELTLEGYYATGITAKSSDPNHIFVTVGDKGGLFDIDVSDPKYPKLESKYIFDGALSVQSKGESIVALAGGTISGFFELVNGTFSKLFDISSIESEAPGHFQIYKKLIYTNAGHENLDVYSRDGQKLFNYPLPGRGNGIALNGDLALLAQGDSGLHVFDVSDDHLGLYLGEIDFPDSGSANDVRSKVLYGQHVVFLSDGSGGFKILRATVGFEMQTSKRPFGCVGKNNKPLTKRAELLIPKELQVLKGNGGMGTATIRFDGVECLYRSRCSSAGVYGFDKCSNGSNWGTPISVQKEVELTLIGSSIWHSSTQVQVVIEKAFKNREDR